MAVAPAQVVEQAASVQGVVAPVQGEEALAEVVLGAVEALARAQAVVARAQGEPVQVVEARALGLVVEPVLGVAAVVAVAVAVVVAVAVAALW